MPKVSFLLAYCYKSHDVRLLTCLFDCDIPTTRHTGLPTAITPTVPLPALPELPLAPDAARALAAHAYARPVTVPSANVAHALNAVSGIFKMSRSVMTVTELWREWSIGTMGRSVASEYESGRAPEWKLHGGDTERKFYQRRKIIVDRLRAVARHHATNEETVAIALDDWCRSNNATLTGLQQAIAKPSDEFEALFPSGS